MAKKEPDFEQIVSDAVSRVRAGNASAFEDVVWQYERPIRAWIAVHAPPGVDIDDVAQRSFVAAFTRIDEFQPGTNFRAWLFAIARYQLKTETTRLRRIADYHTRYAPDLLSRELQRRSEVSPDLTLERLGHLKKCLEQLGDHLRRFVTWRYKEEISLAEMAVRSDRSVAAVKKQLWKIRRTLQECVERRLAVEGDSA